MSEKLNQAWEKVQAQAKEYAVKSADLVELQKLVQETGPRMTGATVSVVGNRLWIDVPIAFTS